jgi:ribosome-binding protein aMBF1 (putative translation factor)
MPEIYAAAFHVQYRVLYFFHGRDIVVLSHGVTKSQKVPNAEIERAMERKQLVMKDPARYAGNSHPRRSDMARASRFHSDTLQYFWDRYIGDDPERIAEYEQAAADVDVAQAIYEMRTQAGLTQRQLAGKLGTTASVVCRLEDADYEGHSLAMLRRIAEVLGKRIEIRFVPADKPKRRPRRVA